MKLFTIGFTRKSARRFFALLRESGAKRIVDVRLNNVSQLAGFAKKEDLAYFLHEICEIGYVHAPELAPTQEMLDDYKSAEATGAPTRRASWTSCASAGSSRPCHVNSLQAAACYAARTSPFTAIAGWSRSTSTDSGAESTLPISDRQAPELRWRICGRAWVRRQATPRLLTPRAGDDDA